MWIDEARICSKLYEDCVLEYKLNSRIVINLIWIWISLFINGAKKLAVINCLHENGSPLDING